MLAIIPNKIRWEDYNLTPKEIQCARWLMHHIFKVRSYNSDQINYKNNDFVQISSVFLRNILNRKIATPFIQKMVDLEFIEIDHSYCYTREYKYCKKYRIHPRLLKNGVTEFKNAFRKEEVTDKFILKQLKQYYQKLKDLTKETGTLHTKQSVEYLEELEDFFRNVKIDRAALELAERHFKMTGTQKAAISLMHIQSIFANEYWSVITENGRWYNSFTNLKSIYRKYIKFNAADTQTKYNLDIKSSQPTIIANLFNRNFLKNDLVLEVLTLDEIKFIDANINRKDVKKYLEITHRSDVYTYLANKVGESRGWAKKNFYNLFGPNYFNSKFIKLFTEEFPTVMEFINLVKNSDYKRLANILQKIEAAIVLYTVSPQLLKFNYKFLTIHDAFLVNASDIQGIKSIIYDTFNKIHFKAYIKIEKALTKLKK